MTLTTQSTSQREEGGGGLGARGGHCAPPSPHSPSQTVKGPKHLVTGILQKGLTASLHSQPVVVFSHSVVSDSAIP